MIIIIISESSDADWLELDLNLRPYVQQEVRRSFLSLTFVVKAPNPIRSLGGLGALLKGSGLFNGHLRDDWYGRIHTRTTDVTHKMAK